MNRKFNTIDYEWLTRPTGDPFADTGGYVIQYLWEKFPDKDIDWLIEYVTKIYVNDWEKTIYFFFPNSPMINNASKHPANDTIANYLELLNDNKGNKDFCRITGRKTMVYKTFKDKYILAGSGKFSNFHHAFNNGLLFSKEIIIRLLFVPLGVLKIGKYMGLVHSNNAIVLQYLVENNIKLNLHNIATGFSKEIAEADHNIATNSIFAYANKCIDNLKIVQDETKAISISLYHFTNYNQGPALDLYKLPSKLFAVYRFWELKHKKDWKTFINRHYYKRDARFDHLKGYYKIDNKEKSEIYKYNDFSKWYNPILVKLINNESIIPEFKKWSKNYNKLHFDIIRSYEQNIRYMKKETIDKVLELADFIIVGRNENEIKKLITALEGKEKGYDLRRVLMKLNKENYLKGNEEPLISVKDYTEYLFSDNVNPREIRDLLIIAIFQKLIENNIKLEVEIEDNVEL
ncbi:MAG: type I-B CRISPR-associated protein Cas8b1/Cst1 [Bacteroidota bacterium]